VPKPSLPDALAFALEAHGDQRRKDGSPYVSHLLQVSGLVLEHGGSLETAMAALLHDVVEDTTATVADVRARFGEEVAAIVDSCTDTIEGLPRGAETWRARKEAYVSHLADTSPAAALVSACDKLHNLRSMARGDATGFHASPAEQRWFYGEIVRVLAARGDVPDAIVEELRSLTDRVG
jgi:(p)ppGpp synthase/HD superfamily hydrolase